MKILLVQGIGYKDWYEFTGEDIDARIKAVAEGFKKRGDRCFVVSVDLKMQEV